MCGERSVKKPSGGKRYKVIYMRRIYRQRLLVLIPKNNPRKSISRIFRRRKHTTTL